ncbi:uncharacterized protein LOC128187492 [Crassostrea angulata]|uniref:uncharacterized protein LOC128187492 n=1 Tax=Magallana angulata TaxID=2784310 RepID=UPI0022B202E0|nr:uncharacterized protein LOC128187492 [Crassostrea angulata]
MYWWLFLDSRSSMYPHDTGSSDSSEPADPDQTIRRGRGRGRGLDTLRGVRGRGRGPRRASRGRGQPRRGAADGPNRAQVAAATLEERNRQLQDRISRLSDCDLRGLVVNIASQHPEFVFDVLDRDDGQHGGHHPPPDGPTPAWCTCTYCREMPMEAERRCCGRTRPNCYSRLPEILSPIYRLGVVECSCNQATWGPGLVDGLRSGVLLSGDLCRSGVRTKQGINMVSSGEPGLTRLSKEGRTGPG